MKKNMILLSFLLLLAGASVAQSLSSSVVSTSGDYYTGTTSTLSVTMGEAVTEFYSAGAYTLGTGFQQSFPEFIKQLMLTLFLQGLYDETAMHKAQNNSGDQFAGTVADRVSVLLHQSVAPYSLVTTISNVDLNTNGSVQCDVPGNYGSNYYVAVQNRNHLETWSATPISFAGGIISYNFTDAASKAYGSNQKVLGGGAYGFFAGDANQDGAVNNNDIDFITAQASLFTRGYVPQDINGDGVVDATDLIMTDNIAATFVQLMRP